MFFLIHVILSCESNWVENLTCLLNGWLKFKQMQAFLMQFWKRFGYAYRRLIVAFHYFSFSVKYLFSNVNLKCE